MQRCVLILYDIKRVLVVVSGKEYTAFMTVSVTELLPFIISNVTTHAIIEPQQLECTVRGQCFVLGNM